MRRIMMLFAVLCPVVLHGQEDQAMVHARKLLSTRPIFDGHNDLPWEIRVNEISKMDVARYPLRTRAPGQTDFARLREGGVGAQFWSVYIPGEFPDSGYARMQLEQIDIARRMIDMYPDELELALGAADVERIRASGKVASMLGMEGGHAIENSLGALRAYYDLGVRYMTLTHNVTLNWADAAADIARYDGLTDFGRDVVREMNRIGMIVDLSHTSPATMRDALEISAAPVMFSHSSARAVLDHPRNVPDDVLKMVTRNGGIVMVTFVPGFISTGQREWTNAMNRAVESITDPATRRDAIRAYRENNPRPRATVSELADHIEHVRDVAGIDHVGLGGDYDGTGELPEGMDDVSGYPQIFAELIRRGWSDEDLLKLANGNILRVIREVERVRDRMARVSS
ncbi:MAG TPA: dipeptidase [Gemmatimonadales bacterium]|nr:dipeptidase [Gemmatimonadales bacterium]